MARINLLPWRAERRAQRQKQFMGMLGASAVIGAVLAFALVNWHGSQVDGQTERNEYLKAQIATLDTHIAQIKELDEQKQHLLARKQVIEQLQANRAQMVHLFDSLVRSIPDGVVLTSIRQEGQVLQLEGRAQSNARVSTYMRMLEASGWMANPELVIIEARPGTPGLPFVFNLRVTQTDPTKPVDTDGDGTPDTPPPASNDAVDLPAQILSDPAPVDPGLADPASPVEDPGDPSPSPSAADPAAPAPSSEPSPDDGGSTP